jgi:hypothetical protein
MPKEILDTIEEVKKDCDKLKEEKGLTAFGEGQLYLANILMEIGDKWREEMKRKGVSGQKI